MEREDAKRIALYYYHELPALRREKARAIRALETEYSGLSAAAPDGMPHAHAPGRTTERLAERADALELRQQIAQLAAQDAVLAGEQARIAGRLDAIKAEYRAILAMKLRDRASWAKITARTGRPESTARRKYRRALERFGEALEDLSDVKTLLEAARTARE